MLLNDNEKYRVFHGDVIPHLHTMPAASVPFSIYSPPFPSVYSYTDSPADLGNSEELQHEAKLHFSFFFSAMRRVMQPGRVMIVHCTQIMRMKRTGGEGMFDFRGLLIRLAARKGFIYDYDWLIRKNPQSQAIRTRSRSLQFAGLESDRAQSRGAMGDYLIKFLAPGENAIPVTDWEVNAYGKRQDGRAGEDDEPMPKRPARNEHGHFRTPEVSRNDWIQWAEAHWSDIRETDTLNAREARSEEDVRHICPLQLEIIRRAIKLYTNPGETVFSPFAGIGSEGYQALLLDRRFYGCELKAEYHAAALRNLARAESRLKEEQSGLFDALNLPVAAEAGAA